MEISELQTLFVKWWNFPGSMADQRFGRAKTLQRQIGRWRDVEHEVSVPFLTTIIIGTAQSDLFVREADSFGENANKFSLLDRVLLTDSSIDDFIDFEITVTNPEAYFLLTFESGQRICGSLADLCSVRLAGIISHRPSPVFYDENYENAFDQELPPIENLASPHMWLPTWTGHETRFRAVAGSPRTGMPLFLYFLSGNYLPDLHGFFSPTAHGPESWADSLMKLRAEDPRKNMPTAWSSPGHAKVRGPLWEPLRLGLLGSIFLSRKILPLVSGRTRRYLLAVDKLLQPWRGNTFLSRKEQEIFQPQGARKGVDILERNNP